MISDYEAWKVLADKEVKGKSLDWQTPEGITVKPLYTADDVTEDPGLPGFAPFTRGVRPQCMRAARGRSGNMRGSPLPRNPTPSIAATLPQGRRA
jgi:methylmalonyl-CoA mutase N-terminal domain/subunit